MKTIPQSTRPDIGKGHFDLALTRTAEINAAGLDTNWHVVHYLRKLIEDDWKRTGRVIPGDLPHKPYHLDLEL